MKGIFKIAGMTCQGCANTIENGLKNDPNIIMATVSLDDMELTTQSTIPLDDKYVDSIISSLGNYKVQNRKKNRATDQKTECCDCHISYKLFHDLLHLKLCLQIFKPWLEASAGLLALPKYYRCIYGYNHGNFRSLHHGELWL